jgi:UDP-2-acetamido-2-deoxy-ribo-hexuluronate aminotransferase
VKFIDLDAQQAEIRHAIEAGIASVLRHGKYILGPEVEQLESRLAAYCGASHCIAVANGTDALQVALMALGVGPGDEVVTPGFGYIAAAEAIALLGAKPVFVDVHGRSFNLDPSLLERAVGPRTKAIIPVSLFGQCPEMDQINAVAAIRGVPVIEDAAQSFGARYKGRRSCNLSDIATTSFFPSKPLGCYGDGGAVFTNDDTLALVIRQLARHGQDRRYHHVRVGVNSRLDTLQAAILLAKLAVFDKELESRAVVARRYLDLFGEHPDFDSSGVTLPVEIPDHSSAWAQFTLALDFRASLLQAFDEAGIPYAIHYPLPVNRQPAVANDEHHLPIGDALASRVVSIPFHPYLSVEEQKLVVSTVYAAARKRTSG